MYVCMYVCITAEILARSLANFYSVSISGQTHEFYNLRDASTNESGQFDNLLPEKKKFMSASVESSLRIHSAIASTATLTML